MDLKKSYYVQEYSFNSLPNQLYGRILFLKPTN